MRKNFFTSISAFFRAMPHFIVFELLFKLIMLAIGAPALALTLKLTMKASGIKYLSDERMFVYLKNPVTLAVIVIILFVLALFSFVELSALAGCFSCYSRGSRLSVGGMFRTGFKAFGKAFRGTGILNFMFFMAFMPMAQFTLSSGVFMAPMLPILHRVFRSVDNKAAIVVYIMIQLLFAIIIVSRMYSIHFLVVTDRKFGDCSKESRKIINNHGKKLQSALSLIIWSLFMLAAAALITLIISFVVLLFIKGFSRPDRAFASSLKVLKYAAQIFSAVSSFLSAPAIMCWLTGRFFADISPDEKIILPDNSHKMSPIPKRILITSIMLSAVLLNMSYLKALYQGNISLNVGLLTKTQITAHRGFSRKAPENTSYAFEAAVDSDADYIELDVQLTKDNQLVVFHDSEISRTTDGKGMLNNYTYDELQTFSAGSWFSKDGRFDDAKIMLLTDVLELVGDDIMMNIEIKNHGNIQLATEMTVDAIKQYGIEHSCYVTSFSYAALKKVKKLDPNIKTGLIANVATTSAFNKLKYIDALSLNYVFVNQTTVNNAHQNGKRIFVWTVDKNSDIKKMVALGVDNIITNRPDKCSEIVYSDNFSEDVLTALKMIFG